MKKTGSSTRGPYKSDEDRRRPRGLRFSDREWTEVKALAEKAGLSTSAYVRRATLRPLAAPKVKSPEVDVLVRQMIRIGNNLNQLVKDWNTGRDPRLDWHVVHDELRLTLQQLDNVLASVAEAYE